VVQGSAAWHPQLEAGAKATSRKRILVVDDEPSVRRLLTDLLSGEGYLVSEAADGMRGLDVLREICPDVVILDMMMPYMNGWTFAEECRRMDSIRAVPIIAISAMFDMQKSANALRSLGVRAFLPKPFDVEVLLSLVSTLL
jgi:CheY-like chemotaxis protein